MGAGVESDLVLLARTEKDLQTTKSDIESSSPGLAVHVVYADLQDLTSLRHVFAECTKISDAAKKREQFVIIHNAGSSCDIT